MKIKYLKLESPSGMPTYRRPATIPGFNFDNTEIFRTFEQFFEDIAGPDKEKIISLLNDSLVSFASSFKILGNYRMYEFRDLVSVGAMKYGEDYYYFNKSGQGMMARIGNSYASYNMYDNGHKLIDANGNKIYEWNSIWDGNCDGVAVNVLEEMQFVKNDGTLTPFDLNVEYSFGYYMAMYDNISDMGAATLVEAGANLFTDVQGQAGAAIYLPELANNGYSMNIYTPREDGAHGIKNVCMLGLKFYNTDGTTSLYEAESDKPYSAVYGEYPFVPQTFSHVNFKHTKPYDKVCITRRIKNDLRATSFNMSDITYPFISVSADTKSGSIDRKDILENELLLGGNYPAGTSKDAYVSYDLYTDALPTDVTAGILIEDAFADVDIPTVNIGALAECITSTKKTAITNNIGSTDTTIATRVFGEKFECHDVVISIGEIVDMMDVFPHVEGLTKEGPDGYPSVDSGGCSGYGSGYGS